MQSYDFTLKYDGGLASKGAMDPVDVAEAYLGAKRLVAAHCHYYTEGHVPRNTSSSTGHFFILGRALERGSVIATVTVAIISSIVYDVAKYSFSNHFLPALDAFFERRQFVEPTFYRIEPVLSGFDRLNQPVFEAQDVESRRLMERTSQSLGQLSRPIGRSATELTMYLDGRKIATLDRRILEYEITEAIRHLEMQRWY